MTTPATGQIWRHNKTGRRIKLRNVDNEWGDWSYETVPSPIERRRTGQIFEYNLIRRYTLEGD